MFAKAVWVPNPAWKSRQRVLNRRSAETSEHSADRAIEERADEKSCIRVTSSVYSASISYFKARERKMKAIVGCWPRSQR